MAYSVVDCPVTDKTVKAKFFTIINLVKENCDKQFTLAVYAGMPVAPNETPFESAIITADNMKAGLNKVAAVLNANPDIKIQLRCTCNVPVDTHHQPLLSNDIEKIVAGMERMHVAAPPPVPAAPPPVSGGLKRPPGPHAAEAATYPAMPAASAVGEPTYQAYQHAHAYPPAPASQPAPAYPPAAYQAPTQAPAHYLPQPAASVSYAPQSGVHDMELFNWINGMCDNKLSLPSNFLLTVDTLERYFTKDAPGYDAKGCWGLMQAAHKRPLNFSTVGGGLGFPNQPPCKSVFGKHAAEKWRMYKGIVA